VLAKGLLVKGAVEALAGFWSGLPGWMTDLRAVGLEPSLESVRRFKIRNRWPHASASLMKSMDQAVARGL